MSSCRRAPALAILALLLASRSAAAPNLLLSGGFEEGDGGYNGLQPGVGVRWETVCGGAHPELYCLDSAVRHSGQFSQRMTCYGYNYRWTGDGGYCFSIARGAEVRHPAPTELGMQAIAQTTVAGAIVPGRRYRASVWARIQGLSEPWEWFRLCIYWLDAGGRFLSETREGDSSRANYGSHDWKQVFAEGQAPEGAAFAKVYLHHHFVHGTVWYDDAALTELAAPSQKKRAAHISAARTLSALERSLLRIAAAHDHRCARTSAGRGQRY